MEFLLPHLAEILLAIMVVDKIVAVTPNKYDDLLITAIKGVMNTIRPGTFPTEPPK